VKHPLLIAIAVLALLGIGGCVVLVGLVMFTTPSAPSMTFRQYADDGVLELEYEERVIDGHRSRLTKHYESRRLAREVWTTDAAPRVEKRAVYDRAGTLEPEHSGIYVDGVRTEPWEPKPADYEPFE
jgi:hypothetical protein